MNLRVLQIAIAALVSAVSTSSLATVDAETPEQVLGMVRMFLSQPAIASDVAEVAKNGCVWTNEIVWFSSPEQPSKGVFLGGGGFTIVYTGKSGEERSRQYGWTSRSEDGNYAVTSIRLPEVDAQDFECD